LPAYDPGLWSPDRAVRPDGLARHKVLDLLGDWFLLELTLRRRVLARVIAIGSGHRDTHVLTDLVLRSITHGILPGSDFVALLRVVQRQYEGGYVSAELYRYLVARIDRWAGRLSSPGRRWDRPNAMAIAALDTLDRSGQWHNSSQMLPPPQFRTAKNSGHTLPSPLTCSKARR
jgi:hypothetical protein